MNRRITSLALAALLMAQGAAAQAPAQAASQDPSALDAPLFYQLLLGELDLRSGDPGAAFAKFIDVARRTRDDALFRRAVEVALQARAGDQALTRAPARPHQFQRHLYDRTQPETLPFLARLRALLDSYGAVAVGEIEDEAPLKVQREYTDGPERLHTAYSFFLLRAREMTPALIEDAMAQWEDARGWPSWSLSNHDVVRFPTRLAGDDLQRTKLMLALLLSLRGTAFLYQGDELGLPHAEVPFERLRDPEAIAFWPSGIGRDGARTPMPWSRAAHVAGFTEAEDAWLPLDPRHRALAVDAQAGVANSVLEFARAMIALRRASLALREGDFVARDAPEPVLAFERRAGEERMLCLFNLGPEPVRLPLSEGAARFSVGHAALLTGAAALNGYAGLFVSL